MSLRSQAIYGNLVETYGPIPKIIRGICYVFLKSPTHFNNGEKVRQYKKRTLIMSAF